MNPDDQTANTEQTPKNGTPATARAAADLIREKVERIYAEEPGVRQELAESVAEKHPTKHQQFILQLSQSGKDISTVQSMWHEYYQQLPDNEKYEVWQEFYESQSAAIRQSVQPPTAVSPQALAHHKAHAKHSEHVVHKPPKSKDLRSTKDIQSSIRKKISAGGKLQAKHHLQSLLFGLGLGVVVVIIFLFGFFNEVFIAPFIQPSRVAAATPIIINANSVAPTTTPEVIIPKINVEIPVDYTETSTNENDIENDLEQGVVHYPTTVLPGQDGNAAYFGHSSNNIFNKGKYKFAFVLLHTMVDGDTFYLTYNDKVYVYKVISHTVVSPSDVGVLGSVPGQTATATLITCDPPGTSLNRLIVVGQQISPDPASNTQANSTIVSTAPTTLPGNGPTLWTRFSHTVIGKAVIILVLIAGFFVVLHWINKKPRPDEQAPEAA